MADIEAFAVRLGALSWVSAELFALEGRWAAEMTSSAAVEHLATQSRHHGWHAGLWAEALPDSPALEARRLIAAPTPGWAAAIDSVDDEELVGDVHRLALLYRGFLPRLAALLDELARDIGGPGEAAIARTLGHVAPDVAADLTRGGALLIATLGDGDASEIAATVTKALDQAFRT